MAIQVFMFGRVGALRNGILLRNEEFDGGRNATLKIRTTDGQGDIAYNYGEDMTFSGRAYDILRQTFILPPNPFASQIRIEIYDDCCKDDQGRDLLIFEGLITYDSISWCEEECTANCSFADNSSVGQAITCLKNTLITDTQPRTGSGTSSGGINEGIAAQYVEYCTEQRPKGVAWVSMFVAFSFLNAFFFLILPFGLGNFRRRFTGCERFHLAVFISSYIKNVCKLCGLNLQSSLFGNNGALELMARIDASKEEGKRNRNETLQAFFDFNTPLINIFDLLNDFREVNIAYQVQNNNFVVERKDKINSGILIDLTAPQNMSLIQSQCYEFDLERPIAGLIAEYSSDLSDSIGNEANRQWSGFAVDFNNPPSLAQSGIKRIQLPFAPVRMVEDNLGNAVVRQFPFRQDPRLGGAISPNNLLFQSGTFSIPKLLFFERVNVGGTILLAVETGTSVVGKFVSPSAFLRENITSQPRQTLYNLLLEDLENPRTTQIKNKSFEVVIDANCETLRNLGNAQNIILSFNGQPRVGDIEEIDFSLGKRQLTIKGKI